MSWLFSGPVDPTAQNFHPVTSAFSPSDSFGELEAKDLEWTCAGGFVTETQIWYHFLEDGSLFFFQVIHAAVGVWYPTVQFTCKIYNPATKEHTWRSLNVTNFSAPPAGSKDKRSCKSDQFSITYKPGPAGDSYTISANVSDDLQLSLVVTNTAQGFKFGKGPKGGFSYFGPDLAKPEASVVHRFWPRTSLSGMIVHKGQAINAAGPGMFIHAIQGMRPNLVASRWNFANFQSNEHGGVSAIQMEFTTTDAYGKKGAGSGFVSVNVGGLVVGGKLVAVTGETKWSGETHADDAILRSRATHKGGSLDSETGYNYPASIVFHWNSPSITDGARTVTADLEIDVGTPVAPKGLVQKVDVLGEIPYALKMVINYAAGTKPYIYQLYNLATLSISGVPGISEVVKGTLFNEATFIS